MAYQKYLAATAKPRVEAAKLRFEEHKLRATLSSASIGGIAATSGILLPDSRSYVAVLEFAFPCLFASTILSLEAMKRVSQHVRDTVIRRTVDEPRDLRDWVAPNTFIIGLIGFAAYIIFIWQSEIKVPIL